MLEEYITLLKGYTANGEHLMFSDDTGSKWEIYYVPASDGDTTTIPVPRGSSYSISGTNDGGFAITINKTGTL